jgi:membrane associated rhomboid family serine protease
MVWLQFQQGSPPGWLRFLVLGIGGGERFGDLTLHELSRGQVWRLITCTFIHYSVVHIVLNLLAFYLLGSLIESWYGSPQLILIYGVTGGVGNLLSALVRRALGSDPSIHAGGGSVVVMGLIGLCAVVGWRSRTARGSDLGWQMSKAIGLTALLGIAFRRYIDNWGHAGGAIVGFALGLGHRAFLRRYGGPRAWGSGVVAAVVILGCWLAQYRADRLETPSRRELGQWVGLLSRRLDLEARATAYRALREALTAVRSPANLGALAALIERAGPALDRGPTRANYRRLRELAGEAASRALTDPEQAEILNRAGAQADRLKSDLRADLRVYREERAEMSARWRQRTGSTGPLVRRAPAR